MKGLVLALGLVLVITYLWVMSVFKKRDSAQDALQFVDSWLEKKIALITQLLALQPMCDEQEELAKTIEKISLDLTQDYARFNYSAIELHFQNMILLHNEMMSFLEAVEGSHQSVQHIGLLEMIQSYQDLEASIKDAYQFYNVSVSELNTAVQVFPGSLMASLLRMEIMPLYPISRGDV